MNKSIFATLPTNIVTILLLVVLSFLGCNSNKGKLHHINELKRISITATGGMKGKKMAISVDSTLTYFYMETYWFTDSTGVFYGKITQGFWDSLNIEIEKIPSKELDSSYGSGNADCRDFTLLITYPNQKKEVKFNSCDCPRSFMDFVNWVWKNQKHIGLKPCFEILPMPLPPPQPITKGLKVTSPHNSKHRHKKK